MVSEFYTGKSIKPSPLGDANKKHLCILVINLSSAFCLGQSFALSSFSCPKKSNNKPTLLSVGKMQRFFDINNKYQRNLRAGGED